MIALPSLLSSAIAQGTVLLYGATGEIITEKSGNLNLGIPGIMYVGAISGVVGGFLYQNAAIDPLPVLAIIIPLISCIIGSLLASLIYGFLTITLKANQNVTGLALTTFGVGVGNFLGGSIIKLTNSDIPFLSLVDLSVYFQKYIPVADNLGWFGKIFLRHGFMVYLAVILAIVASYILNHTRVGLHLRAVGESPATADAAGINVTAYKYVSICVGGAVAGLGGLYFILDYVNGVWANDGFGDMGWLAIAIVIFATWKPSFAILGSYLFGFFSVLYNYLKVGMKMIPIMQLIPYAVTIIVLIAISAMRKRENQPPASLGLSYFREDR